MKKQSTDLTDVAIEQVETIAEGTEIQIRVERKSRKRPLSDERAACWLPTHSCPAYRRRSSMLPSDDTRLEIEVASE